MGDLFLNLLISFVASKLANFLTLDNIKDTFDNIIVGEVVEYKATYVKKYKKELFMTFIVILMFISAFICLIYSMYKIIFINRELSFLNLLLTSSIIFLTMLSDFAILRLENTFATQLRPFLKVNIAIDFFILGGSVFALFVFSQLDVVSIVFLKDLYQYLISTQIVFILINYLILFIVAVYMVVMLFRYLKQKKVIERSFDALLKYLENFYDATTDEAMLQKIEETIYNLINAFYEKQNAENIEGALLEFQELSNELLHSQ